MRDRVGGDNIWITCSAKLVGKFACNREAISNPAPAIKNTIAITKVRVRMNHSLTYGTKEEIGMMTFGIAGCARLEWRFESVHLTVRVGERDAKSNNTIKTSNSTLDPCQRRHKEGDYTKDSTNHFEETSSYSQDTYLLPWSQNDCSPVSGSCRRILVDSDTIEGHSALSRDGINNQQASRQPAPSTSRKLFILINRPTKPYQLYSSSGRTDERVRTLVEETHFIFDTGAVEEQSLLLSARYPMPQSSLPSEERRACERGEPFNPDSAFRTLQNRGE
jgi:hypothetical protein